MPAIYQKSSKSHSTTFPDRAIELPCQEILSGQNATIRLLAEQNNYQIVSWNKLYQKSLFKNITFPIGKIYFENSPTLLAAAEISELLAYFAFLDNIIAGNLDATPVPYFEWLKKHQTELSKNPTLSIKLKLYLRLATTLKGTPYRLFRKIKH